jgi:hypothetical protein
MYCPGSRANARPNDRLPPRSDSPPAQRPAPGPGAQSSRKPGPGGSAPLPLHDNSCAPREMIHRLRTRHASFMVTHFTRPTMVTVPCWLWLAAKSPNTEDKRRCLRAVLQLDADNEPASRALLLLDQQRPPQLVIPPPSPPATTTSACIPPTPPPPSVTSPCAAFTPLLQSSRVRRHPLASSSRSQAAINDSRALPRTARCHASST